MATSRDLRRTLDRLATDLEQELGWAVRDEAADVREDERSWVPVLTGELHDGIDFEVDGLTARVGIFDTGLWWAIYIENGRKNADAQPFVTPAYEASRRRWPRRVEDTVRDVIRRHT